MTKQSAIVLAVIAGTSFAIAEPDAPLRILAIGNSFSQSLCRYFPVAAAEAEADIEFCNLFIGGCPLSRHADNIRKGAENPAFAPYNITWFAADRPDKPRKFKSNVPQMLATQKWDVVTIQQASHESWNPATYRPAADEVIAEIRRLAPQAEIVIQQTWAYNAADGRIGGTNPKWGFDQAGMAKRVERAYAGLANDFGLRVIPVGVAVRLRRAALAAEGRVFDPASLNALAPGLQPDVRGDPVGNYWWKTDSESGQEKLQRDHIHLNRAGEYLQAMVWLGFFTGRDPRTFTYAPKGIFWADDIPGLRAAAARALKESGARLDGRRLVWRDEFGGNTLDPAKWQVWGTMSSTDNVYTNDERTVQVADGLLRLRVLPSGVPDKVALLPRGLVTRDRMTFRYGYLEMRARVPYRRGAWPSFWLQSAPPPLRKADWMSEIDVLESFASTSAAVANLHKWRGKDHVMLPGGEGSPKRAYLFPYPETLNDEFHVYAMEWTPESISFLVDGECFMTVPIDEAHDFAPKPLAGMAGFHDPHYVIFNNEIFTPGHGWCPEDKRLLPSDPFPIDYEIDWVRLWQKDGEALFSRK